jgi:rhodanese-related sulfurtransferase
MKASLPLEIDVEEVAELRAQPDPALRLIDCREDDEWQFCRIDGAELVPLTRFGELASQRFTDPSERIVIYCHHGMRSQRAALFLREHGFENAQSMRGGIDLWSDRVDPKMPKY